MNTSAAEQPPLRRFLPGILLAIYTVYIFLINRGGPRWGDGLELTAVSAHLGIAHPPGYPLFTILGFAFQQLPILASPYDRMLLLCVLSAAAAVAGIYYLLRWFLERLEGVGDATDALSLLGAALFAFSYLMFRASESVEVYTLNVAFNLWIAVIGLRALESECARPLIWACFLQGLAAAHHLTSLCTAPLLLAVAVMRLRGGMHPVQTLFCAAAFLLPPIALYGTMMMRVPPEGGYGIFWGAPQSIAALLDHVRGGEYRQFQFMMASPGVPFTSEQYLAFVTARSYDTLSYLGATIVGRGPTSLLGGLFFQAIAIAGMVTALKNHTGRIPVACLILAAALQQAFILTYNIPDIDGYMLGILAMDLPFFILGLAWIVTLVAKHKQFSPDLTSRALLGAFSFFLALGVLTNFRIGPSPMLQISRDWQQRLEEALPEDAGLLTGMDADVYTLWYLQFAEDRRTDVAVYGSNFMRFPWYRMTMPSEDPRREAVGFTTGGPPDFAGHMRNLREKAIDPMLDHGRLFTTIPDQAILQTLDREYRLIPAPSLLTPAEFQFLVESGEVNIGPPMLYEITPREAVEP